MSDRRVVAGNHRRLQRLFIVSDLPQRTCDLFRDCVAWFPKANRPHPYRFPEVSRGGAIILLARLFTIIPPSPGTDGFLPISWLLLYVRENFFHFLRVGNIGVNFARNILNGNCRLQVALFQKGCRFRPRTGLTYFAAFSQHRGEGDRNYGVVSRGVSEGCVAA